MAKMAETRRTGAKEAAKDRDQNKAPRPFKAQTIDEDEDGNPYLIRNYRVHVVDESVKIFDRELNCKIVEKKAGELDFSRGATVVDWYYDPETGDALGGVCLTHDTQYLQIDPKWTRRIYKNGKDTGKVRISKTVWGEKVEFAMTQQKSPNNPLCRFNVLKDTNEQAKIIDLWQREADAGEWIDGKAPTQEDIQKADKAYRERLAEKNAQKLTGGEQEEEEGPEGAEDDLLQQTGQAF